VTVTGTWEWMVNTASSFNSTFCGILPICSISNLTFPFPTSPQYFSLIYDPFADPIISLPLPRYFSFRLPHLNIPTGQQVPVIL
jgi:hypothetical protein